MISSLQALLRKAFQSAGELGVFQFKRQKQILRQRENLNFQRAQNPPYELELESLEITPYRLIDY